MNHSRHLLAALLLGSLLAGGCSKSTPSDANQGTGASDAKPSNEAAAKAVFDAWLSAQNEGDFNRYNKLYATKLEGVKRSGEKARRFNRSGWMADRERMFQKKMVVEATELKIQPGSTYALLTFTQTWSSGTYKDRGPKQLMLISEDGALRIAREEMLSSERLGGEPPRQIPPDQAAPVLTVSNTHYVVLSSAPEPGWGMGDPRVLSRDNFELLQGVDVGKLPPELSGQQGRPFTLYSSSGVACQATVKSLGILGQVTPHFGMREIWTQEVDGKVPSEAEATAEVWSWTGESRLLVGTLETKGACDQATWARGAALASVTPILLDEPGEPYSSRALEELRKLPVHKKLQKEFETWLKESGTAFSGQWDTFEDAKPEVKLIGKPGPEHKAMVSLTIQAGSGCGSFEGALWVLWEVSGSPEALTWTLANDPSTALPILPSAAVDVDGDGSLELLFKDQGLDMATGFVRLNGSRYEQQQIIRVRYLDCPC